MKKPNLLKHFFAREESTQAIALATVQDHRLFSYAMSFAKYHPDMMIVFAADGEIIYVNQEALYQLLHYRPSHAEDFKRILTVPDYKRLKRAFNQTLRGKSVKIDIERLQHQGQQLSLVLTFIPIKNGEDQAEGLYLIIEDMSTYSAMKHQLLLHEKHLNYAQHIAAVGSWEYFIQHDKLYCSDNFYQIFGFSRSENDGIDRAFQFIHPDDHEKTYDAFNNARKGINLNSEFRIYHGETHDLRYVQAAAEVTWKDNKPFKMVGVVKDQTAFKLLEQALNDTLANYHYIFNHLDAGIWMRDSIRGTMLFASKGLEGILGIPLAKLYEDAEVWINMIHPAHREEVLAYTDYLAIGKSYQVIYRIFTGENQTKWLLEQIVPRLDEKGKVNQIFGLVTDITKEVEREKKLNYLVYYDELTGLPNQLSLHDKVDTLCSAGEPFALLYISINRFHVLNNALGSQIGDELLRVVTQHFAKLLDDTSYLARLDHQHFILVMKKYVSKQHIYALANRLLKIFDTALTIKDYQLHLSASIGIVFYPEEGRKRNILLENAYSALCYAKQQGRNRFHIYAFTEDITSYKQYVLDRDMRQAMLNEEFELYFQPLVEPQKGNIYGAEALIRWHHKEWGLVSPGEFIPLAEENHMIHIITDWVIKKACAFLRKWKQDGHVLRTINIKISPIRLMKRGFVPFLQEQLQLNEIPAHYLQLEITERTILKNSASVMTVLKELQELGVKIAIGDFGTGYSSLESLRTFQPTTLHIYEAFIRQIRHDHPIENGLISTTIYLAKMLGIQVVAKGVESYDQYIFLKQHECHYLQGSIYSKAVPAKAFEKMLAKGFLEPPKAIVHHKPAVERRKYFRFHFPAYVKGSMTIIEMNQQKLAIGHTPIVIENISLGGMKIRSTLKLPINQTMKFQFNFVLMNQSFTIEGTFRWTLEEKYQIYSYGVAFNLTQENEGKLAPIINRMTALHNQHEKIEGTPFIYEDIEAYFKK
ncbi:EAL domain-containing protein [Lysinibacillus sp. FSL L8-0312]|uniref:EAL domain-containing protein n=1 Tax=Lysinibacillus sp. FSL L8-0312 TaxID=2921521 RepID=UPI0030F6F62A